MKTYLKLIDPVMWVFRFILIFLSLYVAILEMFV